MAKHEQETLWQEVFSLSKQVFEALERSAGFGVETHEAQQAEVQLQQLLMRRGDALFLLYSLVSEENDAVEQSKTWLAELEQLNHELGAKLYQRQVNGLKALRHVMEQSLNLNAYKQNELEPYRPAVLEANAFS
jgi:hypothetical protein